MVRRTANDEPAQRGRKPLPPEERRVRRDIIILPATDAWLLARRRGDEPLGHVVDRLVGIEIQREEQVRRFESALPPELSLEDLTGETR